MKYISVVIPVYGCRLSLIELYNRLVKTLNTITSDFEIIMVNDASPDQSWETIKELAELDNRIKGISFSRNFGQHYAISAGLDNCSGQWVVVMDCDLQDQPEEILKLYAKTKEGFDIVLAKRTIRKDNYFKKIFSKIFYRILGYLTDTKQDHTIANFGIYHFKVIKVIRELQDSIRYFPAMVRWVGFNWTSIEIKHTERKTGKTSYNFSKLLNLGIDIIMAFSSKPLKITIKIGFMISFLSILYALYDIIRYFQGYITVSGWTSIIISIWFLSGLIIFFLGVVGLYVGKTFDKVKQRPFYIINQTTW